MIHEELLGAFTAHQRGRGLSRKTTARRLISVGQFSRAIEPVSLTDATPELVELWVFRFKTSATKRAYRSDLQAFYSWAVRHKITTCNPVDSTDPIRVPKSLPRPVAPSWLPAILDAAEPDVRLMIALAAYAGLRVAEISALEKSDVDLLSDAPTLAVRDGKGSKDRIVPVHADLALMLAGRAPGRLVPVCANTISTKVARHLRALGIDATAHKLRHSFGSELARTTSGNVVLVAKLMGHESIQTTMGYIGWAGGPGADAVAAMYPAA